MDNIDVDKLLKQAEKPAQDAMKLHPFYQGKIEVSLKSCVRGIEDFAIWYTPGVAEPCKVIAENKDEVYKYTNKGNFVAVVSDGTRVLGLGDIGAEASMPVMEGKALLFKYLGGVDAFPICVDTKDGDELINFVKLLQPCFGGINLEDIENPKCFYVLDRLREECNIPVWHDDQQGTAMVNLAGLLNALNIVGKKIDQVKVVMFGTGSANVCTIRLFMAAGVNPDNVLMVDSKGILHRGRTDLEEDHAVKWELCQTTNPQMISGGPAEAFRGADVAICLSRPGPGTVKPEWVASMAKDAIIFACANPIPDLALEAKKAGAKIVSTGRSDFPNQVNNSLGFPAIFRGFSMSRPRLLPIACVSPPPGNWPPVPRRWKNPDRILPTMDMWEVFPRWPPRLPSRRSRRVARIKLSRDEIYRKAEERIQRAQRQTHCLMENGFIPAPPAD